MVCATETRRPGSLFHSTTRHKKMSENGKEGKRSIRRKDGRSGGRKSRREKVKPKKKLWWCEGTQSCHLTVGSRHMGDFIGMDDLDDLENLKDLKDLIGVTGWV